MARWLSDVSTPATLKNSLNCIIIIIPDKPETLY